MKILVLGVSGMIGNTIYRVLSSAPELQVWGTTKRHSPVIEGVDHSQNVIPNVEALSDIALLKVFETISPDVVINCIGVVKQLDNANDPLVVLPLNALLPHKLSLLCSINDARLIHISTDCVFLGDRGNYQESTPADADDLYGRSKILGEIDDQDHVITLRTSTIGHETDSSHGLLEWFLSQQQPIKGFTKAIYSGVPTVELAEVIREMVIPNDSLSGLYHVSSKPIDKFSLLKLIATEYHKDTEISEDNSFKIDRSLNADRFEGATGYRPKDWKQLISQIQK